MIFIIGCGTLGSRVATLLKDKELVLIDHDVVKVENLPVQEFSEQDVGLFKVDALEKRCTQAKKHKTFIDTTNIELLEQAEIVIDCTDNLLSRRLLSRYCTNNGIPLIHGAAAANIGIAALFAGRPDLEDLYAHKVSVDTCHSTGIDKETADAVAQKQAELALGQHEESDVYLIKGAKYEQVQLSEHLISKREELPTNFYINWCEQARCMSAKPTTKMHFEEKEGTINEIDYKLFANGEIHFYNEEDADLLVEAAKKIMKQ